MKKYIPEGLLALGALALGSVLLFAASFHLSFRVQHFLVEYLLGLVSAFFLCTCFMIMKYVFLVAYEHHLDPDGTNPIPQDSLKRIEYAATKMHNAQQKYENLRYTEDTVSPSEFRRARRAAKRAEKRTNRYIAKHFEETAYSPHILYEGHTDIVEEDVRAALHRAEQQALHNSPSS